MRMKLPGSKHICLTRLKSNSTLHRPTALCKVWLGRTRGGVYGEQSEGDGVAPVAGRTTTIVILSERK